MTMQKRMERARRLAIGVFSMATLYGGGAAAQSATVEFTVSGNSTIRSWACTVVGRASVTTGSGAAVPGLENGVGAATLTVPVADFACPEDEMKEHLLQALRGDEFPEITFVLGGYDASPAGAMARGTLTILDSTREISLPVAMGASGSATSLRGELGLDMTDYGVEPPVVLGGLMRVRPQIRIQFEGTVGR